MYARAVDEATDRLRSLRMEEWQDFSLAALAVGVALAATELAPTLAIPFFLGGMVVLFRGMIALVRRTELVDRLAVDPDAYLIAEVRRRALRETTLRRRATMAASVRAWLSGPHEPRLREAADELASLAKELEDEALDLHPACAVACARLLYDPQSSPLFDEALRAQEIRSCVCRIRAGFAPAGASAAREMENPQAQ